MVIFNVQMEFGRYRGHWAADIQSATPAIFRCILQWEDHQQQLSRLEMQSRRESPSTGKDAGKILGVDKNVAANVGVARRKVHVMNAPEGHRYNSTIMRQRFRPYRRAARLCIRIIG